jgi:hypothetical protein
MDVNEMLKEKGRFWLYLRHPKLRLVSRNSSILPSKCWTIVCPQGAFSKLSQLDPGPGATMGGILSTGASGSKS